MKLVMKKFVLSVMAIAAIGFTSCGNKTQQQAEEVDSVALVDSIASEAARGSISELEAQLQAGDAGKLQVALAAAKDKIVQLVKENPEVAKEYVGKVQSFLKENAAKIKEVAGDNAAIQTAVSALTDVEPASVVSGFLENVGDAASDAKDAAVDAASNAKDAAVDAATEQVEAAKAATEQKAQEAADAAKKKAGDAVDGAASNIKKGLGL